jgi:signal transduction histidine kinase
MLVLLAWRKSHIKRFVESEERSYKGSVAKPTGITIFLFFSFSVWFIVFFWGSLDFDIKTILSSFTAPTAAALAFAYFYAYKFLEEPAYYYISLGWAFNAFYLPLDLLIRDPCSVNIDGPACYDYRISVFALSLVSTGMFLYAAILNSRKNRGKLEKHENTFSILKSKLAYGLMATLLINILIVFYSEPLAYYFNQSRPIAFRFAISSALGSLLATYTLIYLGYSFRGSFLEQDENLESTENLTRSHQGVSYVIYGFYFYGAIQVFYPFTMYFTINVPAVNVLLFFAGMSFKLVGLAGLIIWLRKKLRDSVEIGKRNVELDKKRIEAEWDYNRLRLEVAEKQQAEKALEIANRELQRELEKNTQLASLGAVVASIEHDIQIPVTNLETKLNELTAKAKEHGIYENISSILKRIEANKNRISASAQIIRFIRTEGNSFQKNKFMSKLSVRKLLDDAIFDVKSGLHLNPKKFFFNDNLGKRDYSIYAYEEMIIHILVNLFKNSLEALEEKNEALEVKDKKGQILIFVRQITDLPQELNDYLEENYPKQVMFSKWIQIEVADKGCGISPHIIDRVTEVFTTKEKANGGIGLFIAKKVLDIHNSVIYFQSQVGYGTTVSLFFPEYSVYKGFLENEIQTGHRVKEELPLENI